MNKAINKNYNGNKLYEEMKSILPFELGNAVRRLTIKNLSDLYIRCKEVMDYSSSELTTNYHDTPTFMLDGNERDEKITKNEYEQFMKGIDFAERLFSTIEMEMIDRRIEEIFFN